MKTRNKQAQIEQALKSITFCTRCIEYNATKHNDRNTLAIVEHLHYFINELHMLTHKAR